MEKVQVSWACRQERRAAADINWMEMIWNGTIRGVKSIQNVLGVPDVYLENAYNNTNKKNLQIKHAEVISLLDLVVTYPKGGWKSIQLQCSRWIPV